MRHEYPLAGALIITLGMPVAASDQLAASVGVEPGRYTLTELVELKAAMDDDDATRIAFLTRDRRALTSTQSIDPAPSQGTGISPGQRQLARSMGVDPAEYSAAELAAMKLDLD